MKRVAALSAVLLAAVAVAVLGTGAGGDDGDGPYEVRAIFDNAFTVIPGLDVKVAGVKIGAVKSTDLTEDKKAAVVLTIDDPAFQDFRSDARCAIRPQSLIGEKFIECTPTEPKPVGSANPPELREITEGEGEGQRLLPVDRTSRPVDIDLVNNVLRRPYRERLRIILSEFGTAVAGQGAELRAAIRRANPALQQTDRVLKILANQNQVLADLARESDRSLAPLARDRERVASFIVNANTVSQASAERREDIEANFERLPTFLRELRPTMERLGGLSRQATPVFRDLGAEADSINRFIKALGPFSQAGIPATTTLGAAAEVGRPALVNSRPIIADIRALTKNGKPVAKNLRELLESLRDTGGVERLADFFVYSTTAINGFDNFGHYLRAGLIANTCTDYLEAVGDPSCRATFRGNVEASASGSKRIASRPATGAAVAAKAGAAARPAAKENAPISLPSAILPGSSGADEPSQQQQQQQQQAAPKAATPKAPAADAGAEATTSSSDEGLLDYLLGDEGR